MATGTVVFQSATLASPPANLAVMADAINDTDHGAGTVQYVKLMDGATAGTLKAGVSANGLAVDVTRVQGTVQALGSVQTVGTSQVLGSVQTVGTSQVLGTTQPLAGSVHLASNLPGGSINAQGVIAHGAAIAGNPLLLAAFGSSGTQAAVSDGQLTRLWADPNGRLQVRGTIDSIGTVQVLGSVQTVGTSQVLGSVQTVGTSQVLGSVQTVGTSQVLGSVQTVGTSQVLGTVRTLIGGTGLGEAFFGTLFTAGVTNGTLVPAPASGTFIRVYDIIVSGSAAGTAFLEFGDGTAFGPAIFAANGGYVFNSARGVRTKTSALDILFNAASGTWGVTVNYILET